MIQMCEKMLSYWNAIRYSKPEPEFLGEAFSLSFSTLDFDKWSLHITRPYTLFGASTWYLWYSSDLLFSWIGYNHKTTLFIEQYPNVVRLYLKKLDAQRVLDGIQDLAENKQLLVQEIFSSAFKLNKEAEKYLALEDKAFLTLNEGIQFFLELGLYATFVPFRILQFLKEGSSLKKECEELRKVSLYPLIMKHCLMPLVVKELKQCGIEEAVEASELVTVQEILSHNVLNVSDRVRARRQGQRFSYLIQDGEESISWHNDSRSLILEMEGISEDDTSSSDILHGNIASQGYAKGVARVVLGDSANGVSFNEGDILVCVSSSPAMMPLILSCSAIVADEGGAGCHAGILARELCKPCVTACKNATTIIKDGDVLEVDARQGTVRILERIKKNREPL